MKNNKGITLIALVVTIIVLLILAGISIAMLTGENGILGNASNAKSNNAYYGATEQMKLAYMAVRTEIAAQTVKNSSYNATAADAVTALTDIVKDDLKDASGNLVGWAVVGSTPKITITYTNSAITSGSIDDNALKPIPKTNGSVEGVITLTAQSASFAVTGE